MLARLLRTKIFWCRIHLWFRYVGGFVRKVDDVTAYLAAQPSRLRAHHRNVTTTRWRLCVTILHLQQCSRRLNLFLFFFSYFKKIWIISTCFLRSSPILIFIEIRQMVASLMQPEKQKWRKEEAFFAGRLTCSINSTYCLPIKCIYICFLCSPQ